jgi:hypothetical protein
MCAAVGPVTVQGWLQRYHLKILYLTGDIRNIVAKLLTAVSGYYAPVLWITTSTEVERSLDGMHTKTTL